MLLRCATKFGTVTCFASTGKRCFTDISHQSGNRWAIIRRRFANEVKTVSKAETVPRDGYSGRTLTQFNTFRLNFIFVKLNKLVE